MEWAVERGSWLMCGIRPLVRQRGHGKIAVSSDPEAALAGRLTR